MAPRVLIVEDDHDVVELYAEILGIYGYELAGFAYNGKEAVQMFEAMHPRPDIVIMDHRLPLMSGIEATKEILRIDPKAKVLFVSADLNSREGALSNGALDFIRKPFEVKDFLSRMKVLSVKALSA